MSVLERILKTKKEEIARQKKKIAVRDLLNTSFAKRDRLSLRQALLTSSLGIIAEFKRKSPSRGYIRENADVTTVVGGYALYGAAACSVLTDREYFGGSLLDLAMARKAVKVPLLRKDFIIDEYQIAEAAAYGADAILLIAAALSVQQTRDLAMVAHSYGLEVLLELHERKELGYIFPEVDIVGVNNRNLATFRTDIYTSFELASYIPACYTKITESGIHSLKTVLSLRQAGFQGVLIGEHFMKTEQPFLALKKFIDDVN